VQQPLKRREYLCMKFYARYCYKNLESFKKSTDVKNWLAVKTVLDKLPEKDKNVIIEV